MSKKEMLQKTIFVNNQMALDDALNNGYGVINVTGELAVTLQNKIRTANAKRNTKAGIGAGSLLVGLFFPPALVVSAVSVLVGNSKLHQYAPDILDDKSIRFVHKKR